MKSFRFAPRPRSVRTRLMAWNICILACILAFLGITIQYMARTNLMTSVDNELEARATSMSGPPFFRPHPPPGRFFPGERGRPIGGGDPSRPSGDPPPPEESDGPPPFSQGFQSNAPPPDRRGPADGPGGPPFSRDDPNAGPPIPGFEHGLHTPRGPQHFPLEDKYRPRMLSVHSHLVPGDSEGPWDKGSFQRAAQGQGGYSTVSIDGEPVRIFSRPLRYRGAVVAVIQSPYPLTEVNRALTGINRALLTLLPVALILAGLGGMILTDRALRPVRAAVLAAEHIGAQDLSQRLPIIGEDEYSRLAMTFNGMLARLEVAFGQQRSLVRRLEELIEQERRFTADASHELKTPLTTIKANTSLMLEGSIPPADYQEVFEEISAATNRMQYLVHDLLLLARYDEEPNGRAFSQLEVGQILKEALESIRRTDARPIRIDVEKNMPCLLGKQEDLARVFSNLLKNAVRYTPESGEIRLTARSGEGKIIIDVADTGSGIAKEHLAHLGERFYRVDPSRSRPDGGTGLGLSICKSIVETHGGSMSIESTLGRGTTVTVTLPQAPTAP